MTSIQIGEQASVVVQLTATAAAGTIATSRGVAQ